MLRLASESYVRMTIVAQMESLVALMANALRLALERRAMLPQIVQRVKLVVIALKVQVNVPLLALENLVNMNHTAQLMNIVVVMLIYANVRNHALVYRANMTVNAHQVNTVLESFTSITAKCVPERTLCKRVTQMVIAPLDNVVATIGVVQEGHATQKR